MKKILSVLTLLSVAVFPLTAQQLDSTKTKGFQYDYNWIETSLDKQLQVVKAQVKANQAAYDNLSSWEKIVLATEPLRPVERNTSVSLHTFKKEKKQFQLPEEKSNFYMLRFNKTDWKNYDNLISVITVGIDNEQVRTEQIRSELYTLYQSNDNFKFPLIVLAARDCGIPLYSLKEKIEAENPGNDLELKLRRYQALNVLEGKELNKIRDLDHLSIWQTLSYLKQQVRN